MTRTTRFAKALKYLREEPPDTRSIRRFDWRSHTLFWSGTRLKEHWHGTDTVHTYQPTQEDILAADWVLE